MTEVGYASDKPSDCAYCYFFSAGRWYSIQTDKRNSVDVGIKIAA